MKGKERFLFARIGDVACTDGTVIRTDRSILFSDTTYNPYTDAHIIDYRSRVNTLRGLLDVHDRCHLVLQWAHQHNLVPVEMLESSRFPSPEEMFAHLSEQDDLGVKWHRDFFVRETVKRKRKFSHLFRNLIENDNHSFAIRESLVNGTRFTTRGKLYFIHRDNAPFDGTVFTPDYSTPMLEVQVDRGGFVVSPSFVSISKNTWFTLIYAPSGCVNLYRFIFPDLPVGESWKFSPTEKTAVNEDALYLFANGADTTGPEFSHTQQIVEQEGPGRTMWEKSDIFFHPLTIHSPFITDEFPASKTFSPKPSSEYPTTTSGVRHYQWDRKHLLWSPPSLNNTTSTPHRKVSSPAFVDPPPKLIEKMLPKDDDKFPYTVGRYGYAVRVNSFPLPYQPIRTQPSGTKLSTNDIFEDLSDMTQLGCALILYNHLVTIRDFLVNNLGYVPYPLAEPYDYEHRSWERINHRTFRSGNTARPTKEWFAHTLAPKHGMRYPALDTTRWVGMMMDADLFIQQWKTLVFTGFFRPQHFDTAIPLPGAPHLQLFPRKTTRTAKNRRRNKTEHYLHIAVGSFYQHVTRPTCCCPVYNKDTLQGGPVLIVPTPTHLCTAGDGTPLFPVDALTVEQHLNYMGKHKTPPVAAGSLWGDTLTWANGTDCDYVYGYNLLTNRFE